MKENGNIDYEALDNLETEHIDALELRKVIKGYTLEEVEPIDYPKTDGLLLYFRNKQGGLYVLEVGICDPAIEDPTPADLFYIKAASVN